jgi:nucleoside-diphosphate-sugar epimerase
MQLRFYNSVSTDLVTGGSGFLGRHLVERLLARGEKNIRVLDRCVLSLNFSIRPSLNRCFSTAHIRIKLYRLISFLLIII